MSKLTQVIFSWCIERRCELWTKVDYLSSKVRFDLWLDWPQWVVMSRKSVGASLASTRKADWWLEKKDVECILFFSLLQPIVDPRLGPSTTVIECCVKLLDFRWFVSEPNNLIFRTDWFQSLKECFVAYICRWWACTIANENVLLGVKPPASKQ